MILSALLTDILIKKHIIIRYLYYHNCYYIDKKYGNNYIYFSK